MAKHQRITPRVQLASVPNGAHTSSLELFDDAHTYFLAAAGLIGGAIDDGYGTKFDDQAGHLLLPMKLLLDGALQPFEDLQLRPGGAFSPA